MSDIPADVIRVIIAASIPSASFDTWSIRATNLLSFSLVNKIWNQIAQDELFISPVIRVTNVKALAAATKLGRWERARELRCWDLDLGKREVKDVLSGCREALKHIWIAGCKRVDLARIAKAKKLLSLHLYESSFEGPPLKVSRPVSSLSKMVYNPSELRFPSLRNLSLLGAVSIDKTQTQYLISLSPKHCPRLEAICASEWTKAEDFLPETGRITTEAELKINRIKIDLKFIILRAIESFQHQLRALSLNWMTLQDCRLPLVHSTGSFLDSLQLLTIRGEMPYHLPVVDLHPTLFSTGLRYLSRPPFRMSTLPPFHMLKTRDPEEIETLHVGRRPFTNGTAKGAEEAFDRALARKWRDDDRKSTVVVWREEIMEKTAWEQALNSGFWKVVEELRESPEWDAWEDVSVEVDFQT